MKIAFLTPEYPHPKTGGSGGIGTSIKNLAMGLLAEGCSVRVLVYAQKEEGVFYDNGICIQQIRNIKFKGLSWYLTRKKLENNINTLYDNKEIDLVEAPDWTGITSFISPKKCPVVIRLNGSDTYFCHLDQRPVKWVNRFHEKRALKNADGLLSVSQFTADTTNEVFHLDKKFSIIPNCIDMDVFNNNNINCNSNNNVNENCHNNGTVNGNNINNKNTILYFGSLIRKKGLLELPFIFNVVVAKKPEAKLILIGKDVPDIISGHSSTWQMMQGLFSPAALLNVTYLGAVPYDEIKNQISRATVCVFPTFAEALPVSWIEAMALEKSIVASNIGWAPEVIDDGVNGFLVHPKDHLHYAAKIIHLMEDSDLQKEFGSAAKKKVSEKFSIQKVALQSLIFYQSLIQ
ncbi:glycosyltransferase family 4 protein [Flavobacterium psychrolimnae]|uniref:Glycosyltransferase family 1 protein n=1 Tax=Flavobacterium psychrolimnae TaxID=249351 RepID=A0A366AZK7_9FLAO|nr:glycosyltransferase family 4 protein [Flavobacterium psychrolimnae]RBN50292.1 glycosyltransferase family 1 protein [Flavobacterium psychrolimnae]